MVGNEPFFIHLADDLIDAEVPCFKQMADMYAEHGGSILGVEPVAPSETDKYGIVATEEKRGRLARVKQIVEKPRPQNAPSNLAVMGRYVFTPEIFEKLEQVKPGVGGEIQLTDAIALLLADQAVYGYVFGEGRYDIGKKLDYLRATVELAIDREDLGPEFRAFLVELV